MAAPIEPERASSPAGPTPGGFPAGKSPAEPEANNRILIADDNTAIHEDFRKVLANHPGPKHDLAEFEAALFGQEKPIVTPPHFELHSAHQGQQALQMTQAAITAGKPFAVAFVDMRMPPGWDGLETICHLWEADPELQIVICTAYSDYSWEEMIARLHFSDKLVLLKKPFDNVEVLQLAHSLTRKWQLSRQAKLKLDALGRMVSERTRELEQANEKLRRETEERLEIERQFRHAQKMEAVGQLAAGVAHDFNNILTVVHGHASLLALQLGENGSHVRSLREIRQSTERAANLVRQLLAFSRKQVMQFRNVEVGEVLRSISGMLRELVGEHITLETDCADGLPPIYADRGMIEQIVVNLTVNSRDAMPRGGKVCLKSSLVCLTPQMLPVNPDARLGEFICLSVRDNGSGMDGETLGHLFEPFFTTKEVGKGTGLGLATVYGIAKQHEAWVNVQSQVGVGTQFDIYFPISEQSGAKAPEDREIKPIRPGTETVLIAEDDPSLREIVSDILQLHGYRVLRAGSGPAALEIWRTEHPRIDLLLTDMVMPGGMMGTELAGELKRDNPNLKVIYTTGYSPGATGLQNALHSGVKFLPKPYSPHKLAQIVRAYLDT